MKKTNHIQIIIPSIQDPFERKRLIPFENKKEYDTGMKEAKRIKAWFAMDKLPVNISIV